ncbi:enoyl-CoA hydratase [Verticiella sediminum]|uniref:Enoyl-CoA hydratase n=1 Tax=Verticiella sediminum TaxID=1247510 RepID=A0A556AQ75_9BURK|nr:enoyl-CoA hydratase-related protein [Verticiella sediminum]TSH95057.1 enoyl-CoA hydratase [Verticiella sediminum]
MTQAYERITVADNDDGTTLITINRAERRNAICRLTAIELQQAFAAFDANDAQRVAVITGAGDEAFSGGADVTDLPELWRCIPTVGITTEKPVICATAGWCVGGALVLAMMADLIVAADNAKFSYPEARLGFTGGMIAELANRIPHHAAMDLILIGRPIDAQRAYQLGFVNEVVPKGEQVRAALAMAAELAASSPLVLRTLKRFVNESVMTAGPSVLAARTQRDLGRVRESEDAKEGVAAFREKRKPRYQGR